MKDTKKTLPILALILALLLMLLGAAGMRGAHTVQIPEGWSGAIRPVRARLRVAGTEDTSVVFTRISDGEQALLGYITPGMTGTIRLTPGEAYRVEGRGTLTLRGARAIPTEAEKAGGA